MTIPTITTPGFTAAATESTGESIYSAVAGNFMGNGIQDLVVDTDVSLQLLVGNGNGTFQAPITLSIPESPYPI